MDWNQRTSSSWNLTGLGQETVPTFDAVSRASSFWIQGTEGNFSVDLKLGQVGKSSEEPTGKWKESEVTKMASSPSGSKRARAANSSSQAISCLVDSCNSDLSQCREYHRRHKVCEFHSKTPEVSINGQKQRFCQQCSRFHSLDEFDEGKRSCRKRLDGHNRRRRKPHPEPFLRSGTFLPNHQGTGLLPFSSSHVYPTSTVATPNWAGVAKPRDEAALYRQQQTQLPLLDKQNPFCASSSGGYREEEKLMFLQGNSRMVSQTSEASVCQPLLKSIDSIATPTGGSSCRIFVDRLAAAQLSDSDCALSLLSSSSSSSGHTPSMSSSHMMPSSSIPLFPHLGDSVLVSMAGNSDVHYQTMFTTGSDSSPIGSEVPQTFPFYWE